MTPSVSLHALVYPGPEQDRYPVNMSDTRRVNELPVGLISNTLSRFISYRSDLGVRVKCSLPCTSHPTELRVGGVSRRQDPKTETESYTTQVGLELTCVQE